MKTQKKLIILVADRTEAIDRNRLRRADQIVFRCLADLAIGKREAVSEIGFG